jgi:hypothetical protein
MTNRRDFLKSSLFSAIALALPISAKPESLINTKAATERAFYTNGVERMRIYSNGYAGIGTIMPPYELKVII